MITEFEPLQGFRPEDEDDKLDGTEAEEELDEDEDSEDEDLGDEDLE